MNITLEQTEAEKLSDVSSSCLCSTHFCENSAFQPELSAFKHIVHPLIRALLQASQAC